MIKQPCAPFAESFWARLGAFLGFLAMLSALAAPASMLAQDVRAGQLSGICSVSTGQLGSGGLDSDGAPQTGAHCEMCGALGWALPSLALVSIPSFAGHHVPLQVATTTLPAIVTGLPFSRAPPSFPA